MWAMVTMVCDGCDDGATMAMRRDDDAGVAMVMMTMMTILVRVQPGG